MVISIENKAYKKIEAYAGLEKHNGEIGGLLLGEIEYDGSITIKNAILLEQIKTDMSFEISDEAIMNLTKNASAKTLKSIIGWWHSHHKMDTFWSSIDGECFSRMCSLSGLCVGIVVAFEKGKYGKMKTRTRVMMKDKKDRMIDIDELPLEVLSNYVYLNLNKIKDDIKSKVSHDERIYITCPTCKGQGELVNGPKPKEKWNFKGVHDLIFDDNNDMQYVG